MDIHINGKLEDISAMLLSAERYALGRQTYIVEWTCSFIANNLHLITEGNRKVMIRDIEQQEEYGYGMKCDEEQWINLLKILKENK